MKKITGTTKLLGVIGDPVKHSLSPVMHNAAIERLGLDYVYVALPVAERNLKEAISGFQAIDLVGFSVTIPHKQSIIPFLSQIEPEAKKVGAVNTVYRSDRGWYGTNTDVEGFVSPLKTREDLKSRVWREIKPVILGNGGAARAIVVGLDGLGCQEIRVVGRDRTKLDRFKQSWQNAGLQASVEAIERSTLPKLLSTTELLINATPIGMHPDIDNSPVDAELIKQLQPGAIVYDTIYTPNPTKFLQLAKNQGAIAIDGLEMLVQQGAVALKIWLQLEEVPVEVMRESLQKHLGLL